MAEESTVHAERPKSSSKKRFSFVSSSNRVYPVVEGSSSEAFPSENTTEQREADDDVAALHTTKKGSTKRRLRSAPLQGLKRKLKEAAGPESVDSSCSTSPTPPSRASLADSGWHESLSERGEAELSATNLTSATEKMDELQEFMSVVAGKFSDVKKDWDELQAQRLQLMEENEQLKLAHQRLSSQHRALQEKHLDLEQSCAELQEVKTKLQRESQEVISSHMKAVKERDAIWQVMTAIQKEMAETVAAYYDMTPNGVRSKLNDLANRLEQILKTGIAPPLSASTDGLLLQDLSSEQLSSSSVDARSLDSGVATERSSARKEKSRRSSRRASEPVVVAQDGTDQSGHIDTIADTIWLNSTTATPAPDSLGLDELWQKRDGSKF